MAGLALGGLVRPLVERAGGIAPLVGWSVPLSLGFFAVVLGGLAWNTRRTVQSDRARLEPHRAVNLLVLGKASALVGAFTAGGYSGYALTFVRSWSVPMGRDRVVQSMLAALLAAAVMIAALLLERACRVPEDDDDDGVPAGRSGPGPS